MENTLKLARELGKGIQQTEAYKKLREYTIKNDNDEKLQEQINEFNMKRIEINTLVQMEKKDEEKLAKLDTAIKELYNDIMKNPNMIAYNEAKKDVDTMMNQINQILVMSVNGEDPETCQIQTSSCSGSCSSCSGCH